MKLNGKIISPENFESFYKIKLTQNDKFLSYVISDAHGILPTGYSDKLRDNFNNNSTLREVFEFVRRNFNPNKNVEIFNKVVKECFGIDMDDKLMKNQLQKKVEKGIKQIILHGAPGTGKTHTAEEFAKEQVKSQVQDPKKEDFEKYIKIVQFHPSFDYTDFIEGLRPIVLKDEEQVKVKDNPTFVRMDGILKEFCRKIVEDENKENKYFLIIDEINRTDLSKVFGDLMYCMNDPQRSAKADDEKRKVQTPYRNLYTYSNDKFLDEKNDVFLTAFLPDNLYIIGTMNDIDRSVESFDFAMRRRFVWIKADDNEEARGALETMLTCAQDDKSAAKTVLDFIIEINNQIARKEDGAENKNGKKSIIKSPEMKMAPKMNMEKNRTYRGLSYRTRIF